jgi:predicted DNA-binding helix-hairpin-helix protein
MRVRRENARLREDGMAKHKFFREGYPPATESNPAARSCPGDFDVDLNTASFEDLSSIPVLGVERARAIIEARPFTRWEQVQHLPDFTDEVVRDLKNGGARIHKAA